MCLDCYNNCETCNEKGDYDDMKCLTCPKDNIKYEQNCYEIVNNNTKSFINQKIMKNQVVINYIINIY